ncbi:hypothetical protein M422DRAFT_87854, partial [Sphaerobolus stellatus SS14]
TPHEIFYKKKPDFSNIPEWGAWVWVHQKDRGKLEPHADVAQWVGYDEDSHGHQVYWPGKRRITVERNIDFEGENSSLDRSGDDILIEVPEDNDRETHQSDKSKNKAQIPVPDPQPQVQAPPVQPQPPVLDTLPNFEPQALEEQDNRMRRSTRLRKPTIYVRNITEGQGTSEQLPSKPAYPKGLQV